MRILITGGTGFVGNNLAKKLIKLGHEVLITGTHTENSVPEGAKLLGLHLNGVDWSQIDGIDILYHQSANNDTTDMDEKEMDQANVYAPQELFEYAREVGCKKFIYASSTAVYGNSDAPYVENITPLAPLNPYGKSKAKFDRFAMMFGSVYKKDGISVIGLRYCNIYGGGEEHKGHRASMIYHLYCQMSARKQPKLFRDGTQKRDWIFIDDVVRANILASSFEGFEIFNVGSGKATSFNGLVLALNAALGTDFEPTYIDNPFSETYQNYTECDISKAKEMLGWEPEYRVQEGIEEYIKRLQE